VALSDRLKAIAFERLGITPLVRVGRAPKVLLCYRSDIALKKIKTGRLLFGNGDAALVEALGKGQQFVAFGIHPTTKQPYRWLGPSPLDVAAVDLPAVAEHRVKAFIIEAETILREAGAKTEKELKGIAEKPARLARVPRQSTGSYPAPTEEEVADALGAIPNTHDWHGWVKIGGAIFDALADDGERLFVEWSAKSSRDDPVATRAKWASFHKSAMKVSSASLFWEARHNGWLSKRERERAEAARKQTGAPHDEISPDDQVPEGDPPDFDAPPPECNEGTEADRIVAEFNDKYLVVNEGGKALVYAPSNDPVLKRCHYDRIGFDDFRRLYMNRVIEAGRDDKDRPVMKSVASVWLSSPRRKQYIGGVAFDPSGVAPEPDVLNLWQGFSVMPAPGDWSLLRQHIGKVLCASDRGLFHYLMGWMARLVQRPAEQGEVAIVMKGAEGTGKGTLARALLRIFGQHGLAISNAKHLTGNFNGHLRDVVLLFADEAFYAGDRQHTGVLKSIITEPYLTVEAKFANAVQQPNFLHLMMASNDEWVVPASLEARRFCVLEAGSEMMGNHEYFGAIWKQMEDGGYEAMLHDLLALDLTTFNVRNVPQTAGLETQRKLSLPIPEAWWRDCLERGYVFKSKLGLEDVFGQWHEVVSTELLFASYSEFAERRRERHPLTRESLGKFLHRMGAKSTRPRNVAVGEHLTDEADQGGSLRRIAKPLRSPRPPGYSIGNLEITRVAFLAATGLTIKWEPDPTNEEN
jgi:hypothetical protein